MGPFACLFQSQPTQASLLHNGSTYQCVQNIYIGLRDLVFETWYISYDNYAIYSGCLQGETQFKALFLDQRLDSLVEFLAENYKSSNVLAYAQRIEVYVWTLCTN